MVKRKERYYGYKGNIPENLKIVNIEKETNTDGILEKERRYVIINADTDEIFDDVQDYGYKSFQKAQVAMYYKKKNKKEIDDIYNTKANVQKWCVEHKSFINELNWLLLDSIETGVPFLEKDFQDLLQSYAIADLPCKTLKEFLRYWT